jgi:hypothetical protein
MGHFRLWRNEQFSHHWCTCHQHPAYPKPIVAGLPNGDKVRSTHTGTLDLPGLPSAARLAHIIPGFASHSLISVVTICNTGCDVLFTKIGCTITYRGRTIMCGNKCTRTGLWMIPLHADSQPTPQQPLHGPSRPWPPTLLQPPRQAIMRVTSTKCYAHHNPIAPERPRAKFRTHNHPRPHSPTYLTPPTTINSNR